MNVSIQGLVCGDYFLLVQGFAFTFSAFKNLFNILFWMNESPAHAFLIIMNFFHLSSRLPPPCVEKI